MKADLLLLLSWLRFLFGFNAVLVHTQLASVLCTHLGVKVKGRKQPLLNILLTVCGMQGALIVRVEEALLWTVWAAGSYYPKCLWFLQSSVLVKSWPYQIPPTRSTPIIQSLCSPTWYWQTGLHYSWGTSAHVLLTDLWATEKWEGALEDLQYLSILSYMFLCAKDERNQVLIAYLWIRQTWHDAYLKWNKEDYDGLDVIHIPSNLVWRPDLVLYNKYARMSQTHTHQFMCQSFTCYIHTSIYSLHQLKRKNYTHWPSGAKHVCFESLLCTVSRVVVPHVYKSVQYCTSVPFTVINDTLFELLLVCVYCLFPCRADDDFSGPMDTNVRLRYNGEITWDAPAITKSSCVVDVSYFPFDSQNCNLTFGSWTYNGNQVQQNTWIHLFNDDWCHLNPKSGQLNEDRLTQVRVMR